jgi:hypothetical protein
MKDTKIFSDISIQFVKIIHFQMCFIFCRAFGTNEQIRLSIQIGKITAINQFFRNTLTLH